MDAGKIYFIRTEGYIGNSIIWWAEDWKGYTSDLRKAGKYTKEEAEEICLARDSEKAYLVETIMNKTDGHKLIFDAQYIDSEDIAFNAKKLMQGKEDSNA